VTETPNDLRDAIRTALAEQQRISGKKADELTEIVLGVIDDQAVDRMADALMQDVRVRSMEIRNGTFEMDLDGAREMAAMYVGMARTMLCGAENYSSTRIIHTVKIAESPEEYELIVQRVGKLTPHEARKRAEAERDEAREALTAESLRADRAENARHQVGEMLHAAQERLAAARRLAGRIHGIAKHPSFAAPADLAQALHEHATQLLDALGTGGGPGGAESDADGLGGGKP
jgi:hypothetical protein